LEQFNRKASYRTNLDDPRLETLMKEGTAYPLDYQAPLSFREIKKLAADEEQR
jgi:hypothetical protein